MNRSPWKFPAALSLALAAGAGGGYWFAGHAAISTAAAAGAPTAAGKPLYWYDPMYPQQHFDAPGKSPFMDMQLVPKYAETAEGAESAASVRVEPGIGQNLGLRLATVTRGPLERSLQVAGVLAFDERDVALLQARAAGFVERTYARAPGDVLPAGAPLADLLVPEWATAQEEFLALRHTAEPTLLAAARQRLLLAGMPRELIAEVERSGKVRTLVTLGSPIAGVIRELDVRPGMTLAAGAPLARINGLRRVWLEAAVPEAQAAGLTPGQSVSAQLPAFPAEKVPGSLTSILADADPQSRTLRLRIELPNPDGRLRPGMSARVDLVQPGPAAVLRIPSEAVIRTGKRDLVMLAEEHGRFRPQQVRLGQESDGQVAVVQGLEEGQRVVASGQFLIDSEASLRGIEARTLEEQP